MEGRNENGGKVFHRHHSGETKRVVVKSESRRFLIFRPSSEWPNAKKGVHSRGKDMKQNHIQSAGMDPFSRLDRTDNGNGMFLFMGKFPHMEWI